MPAGSMYRYVLRFIHDSDCENCAKRSREDATEVATTYFRIIAGEAGAEL